MHSDRVQLVVPAVAAALLLICATPVLAQSSDRERAQMLQMQQQLQRLQSDNASLQRERNQLETQAKDAERLKKESALTGKELSKSRAEAAANARDLAAARAEMEALREQTAKQIEQWKKALEERDTALQAAAVEKRRADAAAALLTARLKAQTGRGDLCESKHAQALQLGTHVVDLYERDRVRWCEPVTGIWKVHNQNEIQQLRDQLYELRLDVPPAQQASAPAAEQASAPK